VKTAKFHAKQALYLQHAASVEIEKP